MTEQNVIFELALLEGVHLARLVRDFRDLLTDRDDDDPAIRRLTPDPYPDDLEAAKSFADSTRLDLLDRRSADASTVGQALEQFDVDVESLTDADALSTRELSIRSGDLDAWLRTLTAIRLVIAERLGITDENDRDDDRADIYDWLGYRLEVLIQAADERDGFRGR